jgi:hypothetical protein
MGKFMKTIWIALSFLGWMSLASAGTYNFYINNTEQGDNGVTTPTVTVKDGKGETSEVPKTDTPNEAKAPHIENPNSYPAAEPSGVPVTPTNGSMAKATYRPGRNLFRVTGGVGTVNMETRTARASRPLRRRPPRPPRERQFRTDGDSSEEHRIEPRPEVHPVSRRRVDSVLIRPRGLIVKT